MSFIHAWLAAAIVIYSQLHAGGAEVGFATIRQGDVKTDSASCNDTYETIMAWTCQPAAIWDHKKSVDVTRYSKSNVDLGRCSVRLLQN